MLNLTILLPAKSVIKRLPAQSVQIPLNPLLETRKLNTCKPVDKLYAFRESLAETTYTVSPTTTTPLQLVTPDAKTVGALPGTTDNNVELV